MLSATVNDMNTGGDEDRWREAGLEARRLRKERGWTQADVAARARLSVRTVGTLENGGRISDANLGDISEVLSTREALEFIVRGWRRMPMSKSVVMDEELARRTAGPVGPLGEDDRFVAHDPEPTGDDKLVTEGRLREEMDRVRDEIAEIIRKELRGH